MQHKAAYESRPQVNDLHPDLQRKTKLKLKYLVPRQVARSKRHLNDKKPASPFGIPKYFRLQGEDSARLTEKLLRAPGHETNMEK